MCDFFQEKIHNNPDELQVGLDIWLMQYIEKSTHYITMGIQESELKPPGCNKIIGEESSGPLILINVLPKDVSIITVFDGIGHSFAALLYRS